MLTNYLCVTCGTQFPASKSPPEHCPICEDERQYVGHDGQQWTTLTDLQTNHHNLIKDVAPHLTGIATEPKFAIGQRALLIQSPEGNILWDCISLIDEPTIAAIKALGGIAAIAISHPHFFSSMVAWSQAFEAPIYLHEANRQWVMRPEADIIFWQGETKPLIANVTLIRCGGHFPGSTVLHWATGAEERGVLLTSDTIYVVADRRYVSFMYSYPNLIPLAAPAVKQVVQAVEPFEFDRIYSGWWDSVVTREAKSAVHRSAERYLKAMTTTP